MTLLRRLLNLTPGWRNGRRGGLKISRSAPTLPQSSLWQIRSEGRSPILPRWIWPQPNRLGYIVGYTAIGLAGLTTFGTSAHAYELQPARWPDNCFTHDGDPRIIAAIEQWAVVSGVRNCGFASDHPDIAIRPMDASLRKFLEDSFSVGYAFRSGDSETTLGCQIIYRDDASDLDWIMLHEVGHCLGLEHSDKVAVMNPGRLDRSAELQADDIAGIRALYGPRVKAFGYWMRMWVSADSGR